ncbi:MULTISPECIES: transcriptional regulator [unclassified Undibacterium]|uniref:transcriptional regulator n=1 Tax=unclassified Undibacterium TaxID=2630295 RepID=UPI002AC90735|nr:MULTISPECIES: transcriptional regulator [unclassified Undibacterium]MEB0140435.1 transcriptional regulator [Undibacterium sp. CCC2.1]MEB0173556.1 transcriptional regulator [Undibacterium sp. CCC1.1]MEB0177482.1 transcriptional regulator [Undibacterium sp. CCC3.4]MEB0214328.1 transcriptional regulator [Undibacterium sp. 5I2]WPX44199.1 transcriptional regulator [Undibacterium sp. CCC3.4]
MSTHEKRALFSKRLEVALRRSPEPVRGATELALRFNLRYKGESISPQTAHKWLTGRAIPRSDKLHTIAIWLGVEEHWLHYGPPPSALDESKKIELLPPTPEMIILAQKIQALPAHQRYLIEDLIVQLRRD